MAFAPLAYINIANVGDDVCKCRIFVKGFSTSLMRKISRLACCRFGLVYLVHLAVYLLVPVSVPRLICPGSYINLFFSSIRFRAAWKAQGHSIEELPFQALGGAYGSWFGVVLIVLVLIAQFYIAVAPLTPLAGSAAVAENFFRTCFK